MTVTPLPSRPSARRRSRAIASAAPALTVSFDVTLTGEDRHADALAVLETLRGLTDRLDTARVTVAPERLPRSAIGRVVDEDTLRVFADSRTVSRGTGPWC